MCKKKLYIQISPHSSETFFNWNCYSISIVWWMLEKSSNFANPPWKFPSNCYKKYMKLFSFPSQEACRKCEMGKRENEPHAGRETYINKYTQTILCDILSSRKAEKNYIFFKLIRDCRCFSSHKTIACSIELWVHSD